VYGIGEGISRSGGEELSISLNVNMKNLTKNG
jgi:hypothetical protein